LRPKAKGAAPKTPASSAMSGRRFIRVEELVVLLWISV
jgi:hypothetical protein